jgi:flagellar protein FlaG
MSTSINVKPPGFATSPPVGGIAPTRLIPQPSEHGSERNDNVPADFQSKAEDPEALARAIGDLKEAARSSVNRELRFSIDKDSGRTVVKVVDADSGETIRQLPPEEVLRLHEQLNEQRGFLFKALA